MDIEPITADQITAEQMLDAADAALWNYKRRHLTDAERATIRGAIADQTYEQISEQSGYAISYLKRDVGPKLWRSLSEALGEDVSKTNFRGALVRYHLTTASSSPEVPTTNSPQALPQLDSGPTSTQSSGNCSGRSAQGAPWPDALVPLPLGMNPQTALIPDVYVQRPPIESLCLETLRSPGALIRVKAPTLIGKTSLMNWVMADLEAQGFYTASLSLKLAERSVHFTGLDRFLRWFCVNLGRELRMANQLDDYWDEETLGAKMSCSTYVEDYVLAQVQHPILLCLDDVDLLFPYPEICEDFFGLVRSWHEKAKTRQIWQKLRIALVYSTDVYIPLNINHSPFNVGVLIEPPEFTTAQVQEFAIKLGVPDSEALIQPLMQLVGGHPYLLEQAFVYLKTHSAAALDEILATASTNAGIYKNHLRRLWLTLQERPDLAIAFHTIVSSPEPVQLPPILAYQLQSLGLVELVGNAVATRFPLYRQYFADHFQSSGYTLMPDAVDLARRGTGRDRTGK